MIKLNVGKERALSTIIKVVDELNFDGSHNIYTLRRLCRLTHNNVTIFVPKINVFQRLAHIQLTTNNVTRDVWVS